MLREEAVIRVMHAATVSTYNYMYIYLYLHTCISVLHVLVYCTCYTVLLLRMCVHFQSYYLYMPESVHCCVTVSEHFVLHTCAVCSNPFTLYTALRCYFYHIHITDQKQ
jgi:hypothetical protein